MRPITNNLVRKWRYQARDSSISLVQDIELAFTLEQPES